MRTTTAPALVVLLLLSAGPLSAQSLCRFGIASQYDYEGNRGFYLDFEGSELLTLPIFLSVADGTSWRWPSYTPGFQFDRDYRIRAVISGTGAQLFLDGALVIDSPGGWQPAPGEAELNYRPSWADEPGDWIAIVDSISVALTRDGQEIARHEQTDIGVHAALKLFEQQSPTRFWFGTQPGDTVTIDATFRFAGSDLHAYAPFIDQYGQCVYADFSEKITSDDELVAEIASEDAALAQMPPSSEFDEYGGYLRAGWQEEATGFFGVLKRDGHWWLISPDGNPCFYLGVSLVPASRWPFTSVTGREYLFQWLPPRDGPWEAAWDRDVWGEDEEAEYVNLYQCNLIRKYGSDDWSERARERALRRLDAWGFNGGGKWGAPDAIVSTPVLSTSITPTLAGHPDFFDPAVQDGFRQELANQIGPRRDDPNVLGWSFQSEYEALIRRDEIREILTKPADTASKRALLDHALDVMYGGSVSALASAWGLSVTTREELYASNPSPPEGDVETMRRWYADRWYDFVYTTIKSIDPNHLVIAPWIVPRWWEDEQDWHLQARHCDVMGYDRYFMQYEDKLLARLQSETDKPTLCGEFSFPQFYRGERGFGRYWSSRVETEAEAGDLYYQTIQSAAADASCVGMIWFHYRDQPLTGRGAGFGPDLVYGEHYAFGLVTETDRVKWPLVTRMREANLQAARWRWEASGRPFRDIPSDHWAKTEITACAAAGIVSGYPDGYYRPEWIVSRDQMAVFISRALAGATIPAGPGEPTFLDVPTDHWAYDHVEYAVAEGIVEGYTAEAYHPEYDVSRAQMAVFIARAIVTPTGEAGLESYQPPDTPTFRDVPADSWCYKQVEYLAAKNLVSGYPDGNYYPARRVSRDQMAVFISRAFELPG
ncbi:MAG: S-layer homology domain-containing protein [Armatimonadota bacterium]|nr:MAG: S-layer homology domain-containing protein [Armatimonadota bacterium]